MKRWIAASILALAPLTASSAVYAQSDQSQNQTRDRTQAAAMAYGPVEGSNEFTLSGTGTNDKNFDTGGFGVSGSYGWYMNRNVELAIRQSVNWTAVDNASDRINGSTRGAADYHFDATDRFRPFVGASVGVIYGDGVHDTGTIGPEVGMKYYLNPTTFLVAQGEYQFFFDSGDDIDNNIDDGSFAYSVGLGLNF